jgi:hypothetical protein
MSTLIERLGKLVSAIFSTTRAPVDPDAMSVHDWADLPVHHPRGDRAPC